MIFTPETLKSVLNVVQLALPLIKGAGPVGDIITILAAAVPAAIQVGEAALPSVKNIITALKTKNVTPEQMKALRAHERDIDAAYDAIKARVQAEDKA